MSLRRIADTGLVLALIGAFALIGLPTGGPAGAAVPSSAVSKTWTASRIHLNADGTETTALSNTLTLKVDHTANLRGREQLSVTWSGAHPTGGVWPDENSGDAAKAEYPFVLVECRGLDDTGSASGALNPDTCWTQTAPERYVASSGEAWPVWRQDRYETDADRQQFAAAPNPLPASCIDNPAASRWVPFIGADGTVFEGGSGGCAGQAPESANVGGSAVPSNTTYGITASDGTGEAKFDVWTDAENASLGCSYLVPCSLVAVPIEGLSCDIAGAGLPADQRVPADDVADATTECQATGEYAAGEPENAGVFPDIAVTGSLWWSASNWRNRMSIPLTFAEPSSVCDVVSNASTVDIYGSELMAEASEQWAPYFCTNSALFNLTHVQTAEPEARSLLAAGSIDAAYTSNAPADGFGRPVVQAPVAVTGFAITYVIDDSSGNEYGSLRLNPRLLAKLLTQSYPGDGVVRDNYKALANNPLNITLDPEFQALNPGLAQLPGNPTASTLLSLSTDSDVMYALTSYINSDPEARAWLDGKADPWGMVVNPSYKKIALPVTRWQLQDSFLLPKSYIDSGLNPCYSNSPAPYLGLIAAPMASLADIAQRVEFALSNVGTACPNGVADDPASLKLSSLGRQQPGHRFMLALSSLGEVNRYQLTPAALQSASTVPTGKFTTAAGRSFVLPTADSLKAAVATLQPDTSRGTWPINYPRLRTHRTAYPATMVVYADIPTQGLDSALAKRYGQYLTAAATTLQSPGQTNGHLPNGYLPLTAGDGLGKLAAYTAAAAGAVAAQTGVVPSLTSPGSGGSTPSSGVNPPTGPTPSVSLPGSAPGAQGVAGTYPSVIRGQIGSNNQLRTVAARSNLAGTAMPFIVTLGLISLALSAVLRVVPRMGPPSVPTWSGLVAAAQRSRGAGRRNARARRRGRRR